MNPVWSSCEIYGCIDPRCGSRILILQTSRMVVPRPRIPRCVCGAFLMLQALPPAEAQAPEGECRRLPPEEKAVP